MFPNPPPPLWHPQWTKNLLLSSASSGQKPSSSLAPLVDKTSSPPLLSSATSGNTNQMNHCILLCTISEVDFMVWIVNLVFCYISFLQEW